MRKIYSAPPADLRILFTFEWRRAKKLLAPALDKMPKPKLYIGKLRSCLGWCRYGNDSTIAHKVNGRWVKCRNLIAISDRHYAEHGVGEKVRNTVRHEICHVVQPNHSWRFHTLLNQLNK